MNVDIVKMKLKCICCKKIIPESKVFVIVKEDEEFKHMCGNCFIYVTNLRLLTA